MEKRIIIAGSGGQGALFLGRLMAYSAMLGGKHVTWFPSYGAEMRGGTANCTVIISAEMIGSPVTRSADMLIVMNDASYRRFSERLLPGGLLMYDSSLVSTNGRREDIESIAIPASTIAASMRHTKSANMVMLGAFVSLTGLLSLDPVMTALQELIPSRRRDSLQTNKDLIMKGHSLIEDTEGHGSRYKADTQARQ